MGRLCKITLSGARLVPGARPVRGGLARWLLGVALLLALSAGGVLAQAAAPPARPAPPVLRDSLRRILARPEYNQARNPWLDKWVQRLLRAFLNWYREHLAGRFERLHEASPVLYWGVVAVGAAVVLVLLYHIYLTLRSAFGVREARRRGQGLAARDEAQAAPEALLGEADRAAAAGDYLLALSRLYLALIRNLDRHGLVRYDRSHTNHEYLRQVRGEAAVAGPLAALTQQAEGVWYGRGGLDARGYQQCRALALAAWQGGNNHAAP